MTLFPLDRKSPVPLYFQLSQHIEKAIQDGVLHPGQMIDTEMNIASTHGLSRPTVRQAIQDLVNKGLLVRKRGVGTQVVSAPMRRSVELTSLYDDLHKAERNPTTQVLTLKLVAAPDDVAQALGQLSGTDVFFIERLRSVDAAPLAIMRNWLPKGLAHLTREALEREGLYELLRQQGVQIRLASQRIGAAAANNTQAQLLGVRRGSPLLTMERTAFNDNGDRVEYSSHVYRSDAYSFETMLVAK